MAKRCDEPDPDLIATLSPRELSVFRHIGQGHTAPEISQALGIETSTVETYRERIKEKLGLENGAELSRDAAIWCHEHPE
jgi:DNA-binding NarL/FixJ family response regulator